VDELLQLHAKDAVFERPCGYSMMRIDTARVNTVKEYINKTWLSLTRSNQHILISLNDPKLPEIYNEKRILYIAKNEELSKIKKQLSEFLTKDELHTIHIKYLPAAYAHLKWHGLLYLPYPYIVPGGRFNEMYGWDSNFIVMGILNDGYLELARNIIDNTLYQIEHYGKILNANRSYYLDRSQPPMLTQMVLAFYKRLGDKLWLSSTIETIEKYYAYWITPPKLISDIGLSRYYVTSWRPAIEVIYSELDENGCNHYQRVKEYYKTYKVQSYKIKKFYSREKDQLTRAFYQGDRSARESGMDPSSKFGPLGAATTYYAPICLNTLLYQMEIDIAEIYRIINKNEISNEWLLKADKRKKLINHYCWDQDLGYYFDYNTSWQRTRAYICATTFYPLWAGIASADQAQRIVQNLPALEAPGGLLTSAYMTGNQWDSPFGWAPLHFFAVKGLVRYGYHQTAKRLACKFINLINNEFASYQVIFEKYDVSKRSSRVKKSLKFGYQSNEIGFGWTNAIYLELLKIVELA
jgi:alpha,alpha-trehalase